jgi:hypothetical protein
MLLLEQTHYNQSALASYCRTGKYKTIPGVNKKNITQYRRLVFSVVDDMLKSAFPLTRNLLSAREWSSLTKEFFSEHPCSSPQVWYMPKELHQYVSNTAHPLLNKYPHLLELLWFEWLEIELYMMMDKTTTHISTGDIYMDRLILNPESYFQHFQYPVHLANAKTITKANQANYYLAAHRVPETGEISFTDMSPALLRMLELLADQPYTLIQLTERICSELNIHYTDDILKTTANFVQTSIQSGLIIGFAA